MMAFTVVPLHKLSLPKGANYSFGKFTIQDVPEWLLKNDILDDLCAEERRGVKEARQALVSEYYAESYGHPDPEWQGKEPKGIQDLRWQSALLANMCLWFIQPSPVFLTVGFHGFTEDLDTPFVQAISRESRLFCHERDRGNIITPVHLAKAAGLFEALSSVSRKNAVWASLRAIWGALTSYQPDMSYPLFWQAMESLFGSDAEIFGVTKRLRDRISYFLAGNSADQKSLAEKIEACYAKRSDIVHGRWEDSEEFHKVNVYDTECIVRTVIRQIADRPGMLAKFLSPKRSDFLEAWVKSKSFTAPTLF